MEPMSDWPTSFGVIGCGAMGTAMAAGLVRGDPERAERLILSDAISAVAERAAELTGGRVGLVSDAAACDLVVLAVKPKDAASALQEVSRVAREDTVLVSVIAGWDIGRLAAGAPAVRAVVRTMPNLAVQHGRGLVVLATHGLHDEQKIALQSVLGSLGVVIELPENLIGPATALVGSGPGFVALIAEGLEDGAVAVGFSRDQARRMVQAVIAGTGTLLDGGVDPAELRQRVSSPAGTTIEGVAVLERGGVRGHLADAVRAAARRATEL
jgi:pyrroline-5-carboxylate reductase